MLAMDVALGADGLDRAAAMRSDTARQAELWARADAGCAVLWQGKPLVRPRHGLGLGLVLVPPFDPLIADARKEAVFLGRINGAPRFAVDLSALQVSGADAAELGAFADPSCQSHPGLPEGSVFVELRGSFTQMAAEEAGLAATARALLTWHASHRFCARCGAESHPVMAGWQRSCPACGAQHYPRVDPVVIILALSGNRVLVGRSPGWPEGMYSLLAGYVEPGETLAEAARREVAEEAAVVLGPVRVVESQPWPFPGSLMIGCVAEAETDAIRIDPTEIEDALWVSREEMVDVVSGHHPRLKPARPGAIARALIDRWIAGKLP